MCLVNYDEFIYFYYCPLLSTGTLIVDNKDDCVSVPSKNLQFICLGAGLSIHNYIDRLRAKLAVEILQGSAMVCVTP